MLIKRDKYLKDLILRQNNGLIKVITGMRRCGKSYLLNQIFFGWLLTNGVDDGHIIRLAFDSAEDLEKMGESLLEIKKQKRLANPSLFIEYIKTKIKDDENYYLLLDEVQLLENFESVLNGYLYKQNIDIYVTGSNSRFLSKDVVTEFRGRGDLVHVLPLSFSEFYSFRSGDKYEAWNDYFVYGGLPFVATLKTEEQKISYLDNLFKETYLKDIIERNKIRKSEELENLVDVLASGIGSLTNVGKIQKTFASTIKSKISCDTIKDYVEHLKDSFVLNEASRYNIKGRKYIGAQQKYYFEDVGLRNARLKFRQNEENHIMENIIYNELRYRGFQVDVGIVEKRSADGKKNVQLEVDFVANKGSQRFYIQSAFSLNSSEKEFQEKQSLQNLRDSFKKIIVTKGPLKLCRDDSGIETVGILEFLLNVGDILK